VRACNEWDAGSAASGEKRDAGASESMSKALCDLGDRVGLRMRRRMGERWPETSARKTSFCFASSLATFQPIGMPMVASYRVKSRGDDDEGEWWC
jgi:hypothetical protein